MDNLIDFADSFAEYAHRNQKRKYTKEPYIEHPREVCNILKSKAKNVTKEMLIASLLHDTVEDTDVTIEDIKHYFGKEVAYLVECLTDVSKLSDGSREKRKEIDRLHLAKASPQAKTIKLADLINNTESITKYDKVFAITYMKEKRLLLKVLKQGDKRLYKIASEIVNKFFKELDNGQ